MYFSNETSNTPFFILTFACISICCLLFDVQFWRCQNSEESLLIVAAKCKYLKISTIYFLVTRIKSVICISHNEKKIVHFSGEWLSPWREVEINFNTSNTVPTFSLIRVNSFFFCARHVLFRVCKSVHHYTLNWINQQDPATSQVYYLSFRYSSTRFGHLHAHHQELEQMQ